MTILHRVRGPQRDKPMGPSIPNRGGHPLLTIATMQRRHIRAIMAIESVVYPRPWSEKVFAEEIEMMGRGRRHYIVAAIGRQLVGYGGLLFAENDAHVTNIAVDPKWQQRGVATELMLELASEAMNRECEAMTLEVRHTNMAAQEMYRRFGFVPAGIRNKYYENKDDAIVMWCTDIQSPQYARRLREIVRSRP